MKKIIIGIVLMFALFIAPSSILAQTPPFSVTIPGTNCGVAEDAQKNQCCNIFYPTINVPPSMPAMNAVLPFLQGGIDIVNKFFYQSLINVTKQVSTPCVSGVPSMNDYDNPACKCINPITPSPAYLKVMNEFCQRQNQVSDRNACLACANDGGVYSGIGCIKTDIRKFIEETVFGLGIGLAGGFSLLCIIYAAFMMQSSQGNPEKLKKAQEMITSCIMGLMLIIFSVFVLRLIGVNILRIPGFN